MMNRGVRSVVLCASIGLLLAACSDSKTNGPTALGNTADFDATVPTTWFRLAYNLVKTESYSPPRASRAFGYFGVALYEAVVPGMPTYQTLVGQLKGLETLPKATDPPYHWPTVANAALATIMRGLFEGASAATLDSIDELEARFNTDFNTSALKTGEFDRSVAYGQTIGIAILEWSRRDRFGILHNCTGYTPTGLPGHWRVTPPGNSPALEPCWGDLRPFVIDSGSTCDPGPPPTYSETIGSQFMNDVMEVYNTSSRLTKEDTAIAEFWSDGAGQTGTPPGHSIMIATQILEMKQATLESAAETYAKVGMAVADAFIGCWWSKFKWDFIRPISAIHDLVNPNWTPLITTPNFPEYTSGHSAQSAAAAQVLTDLFGPVAFTDHTNDSRDLAPRSFNTFFEFSDEAAISRLYGGIHFRTAIMNGLVQGKCIGQKVSALHFNAALVSQ